MLGRVSNLPTVWTNVVVGWVVGRGMMPDLELIWLVVGISLLYWAGMALNDAFDVEWDREHAPERPIPSGAISARATWGLGIGLMVAGCAVVLLLTTAPWFILVGLVAAILLYDWLHKRWSGSVLLMGICRALVYYLGYCTARFEMALPDVSNFIHILALGVVLYIGSLTMIARGERGETDTAKGIIVRILLMLPVAYPVIALICDFFVVTLPVLITCICVVAVWIIWCRSLIDVGRVPQGIGGGIAGIALYDASVALLYDGRVCVFCLLAFVLTLVLQRVVPPT